MTDDLRQAFAALDLPPGASAGEVRLAYLDLVKIWHPDRYQNEPERLRQRAERKLKEITLAYERLRGLVDTGPSNDPIPMDFGARWGYINEAGDTIIHPEYLAVRPFKEGLAAVQLVDKWGFIDTGGIYQVNPLYEAVGDFSEGLAAVRWYGRWGYIDRGGAFAVQPRFQEAAAFANGWGSIKLGARRGRVSRDGQVEFDPVAGRHIGDP